MMNYLETLYENPLFKIVKAVIMAPNTKSIELID